MLSRGKRLLLWAVEKPPQYLAEVGWPRCRSNATGSGIGTPRSRGDFICVLSFAGIIHAPTYNCFVRFMERYLTRTNWINGRQ